MQIIIVVENEGQIEDFEILDAQRAELGQRGCEHLDGAELQGLHFFLVFVELAVGVNLYLDLTLRQFLGALLEKFSGQPFGSINSNNMAELDRNRLSKGKTRKKN